MREDHHVVLGQRIGVVRFGSQVDLVLPDDAESRVLVDLGRRVRAGESFVAEAAT